MKLRLILFLFVLILFLTSCSRDKTTDYSTYNQPRQSDSPYVGGGCGVAPMNNNYQSENIGPMPVF